MGLARILIVDDESSICDGVDVILSREGYEVRRARTGEEAVEMAAREEFDVILMDLILPGMDGADACARIKKLRPDVRVVAVSGSPEDRRVDKFMHSGGTEIFLCKPFGKKELLAGVKQALELA